MIISKTPMRITLGGGGTDVLWYSSLKGGAWISGAINKYLIISLYENQQNNINVQYRNKPVDNSIIRQCLKLTHVLKGLDIKITSDVPSKSGLGGSGAFEVGLLHALYRYRKVPLSQLELAQKAFAIEAKYLKKPVGPQDQYITALGGIKYFEIDKNGNVLVESLKLSPSTLSKLENKLLYFQTNLQHDTSSILGDEKKKLFYPKSCKKLIHALDEIKTLGIQAKKYLLNGKIDDFGQLLHEHWLIKKSLSNKVTTDKIDEWYNEALKAGALGGKIMGAGGGGWFVFYVNSNKAKFREKMQKIGLKEHHVNFNWKGTQAYEKYLSNR